MTRLPVPVAHYLERVREAQNAPVCLEISRERRVVGWWGDPALYGLAITRGAHVRTAAPFLEPLPPDAPTVISFVNTKPGEAAHVHVLPAAGGWYAVFLCATDELRQRQALQQNANELRLLSVRQQRLLGELVEARSELEIRRDQAEQVSRSKGRFIARMSHEFRTPLAAVIGYAKLLGADAEQRQARERAGAIERCAEHLIALADQILDQARLEEGEVVIRAEAVDPRALVEQLTTIMGPLAADKSLAFAAYVDSDLPQRLWLDGLRLRQVLLNLLGNAVKFTDGGGVRLELDWSDGTLTARVEDSGPGIAPADQERFFRPFQRGDERVEAGGAGLGLDITARIVALMGGRIELDSAPGCGSRFSVRVPAPVQSPATLAAPPAGPAAMGPMVATPSGPRVLIAEDDPDMAVLLELFLRRAGYTSSSTDNGEEAVRRASAEQPDVLVLDMGLPVLDGPAAATRLRSAGYSRPILGLSAGATSEERARALAAGCSEFLTKPVDPEDLVAAVERLSRSVAAS